MSTNRLSRTALPIALAIAALALSMTAIVALADGPIIDTQTPSAAVSTMYGEAANAKTGHAIATGDINGDGYQDLVIGAPYADVVPALVSTTCTGQSYNEYVDCVSGGVYLYLGRPEISNILDLAAEPANVTFYASAFQGEEDSGEQLGRSVAVGDLNGDGLDDIIMGSNSYWSSPVGAAYVWVGRAAITTTTAISVDIGKPAKPLQNGHSLKFVGAWQKDQLGWDVATGDVNGDDIDDLIVGAFEASVDTVTNAGYFPPDYQRYHASAADRIKNGAVYVRLGSPALIATDGGTETPMRCLPELTIYGKDSYDNLGRSLASGDIDNDGFDDIIIGADGGDPNSINNAGEVYVFYGSNAITYTNCSVLPPTPYAENQIVKELAYITTTANITLTGFASGGRSGFDVSTGDLNNDNYDDIIIGAPYANSNRGRVYVVYGGARASMISQTISLNNADTTVLGTPTNTWLGSSVFAGDVDGNGISDLIMGAIGLDPDDADYSATPDSSLKGTAYVLFDSSLGGSINLSTTGADLTILGASADDWLGRGLGTGDLNNDGYNELLVGAAGLDHGGSLADTGAAYIIDLAAPYYITVTGSLAEASAGDTVNFSAVAHSLFESWDVTSETNFSISPGAGGTWVGNQYTAVGDGTWTVTGTFDGLAATTSLTVLPSAPTASFSCSPTCSQAEGTPLGFNAGASTDPNLDPLTYAWTFGDKSNGTGQTPSHAFPDNGTYTVTLVVEDDTALTDTISHIVTIINAAPTIQTIVNTSPISEGESATITVTASDVPSDTLTYAFDCNADLTFEIGPQASNQASCQFFNRGSFTVYVRVADEDGGSSQGSTRIQVGSLMNFYLPLIMRHFP